MNSSTYIAIIIMWIIIIYVLLRNRRAVIVRKIRKHREAYKKARGFAPRAFCVLQKSALQGLFQCAGQLIRAGCAARTALNALEAGDGLLNLHALD